MLAVGAVRALDHRLPCRLLCLPKVEHRNAVSIRVVVGGADPGDLIGLLADVVAGDPGAGLTITEPAIAEMQPALDGPVIGLPPDLEPAPRLAAVERLVVNFPGHCFPPVCRCACGLHSNRWTRSGVTNVCPTYGRKQPSTSLDESVQKCPCLL